VRRSAQVTDAEREDVLAFGTIVLAEIEITDNASGPAVAFADSTARLRQSSVKHH
jgi:hypothetical protein